MTLVPQRGYQALRHGRFSQAGCEYFLTFCTQNRQRILHRSPIAIEILAQVQQLQSDLVWIVSCAVVMPDHVHLLIRLGERLALGKAVARLKSKTASRLKEHELKWQPGYFEHRLRPGESRLPVVLYIYLNPYRAGLIPASAPWPWFLCGPEDKEWFLPYLNQGLPEPAWLSDDP